MKKMALLLLPSFTAVVLAAACSSHPSSDGASAAGGASAASAASPMNVAASVPTKTPAHDAWHRAVSRTRAPNAGCFEIKEPSTELVEVPCGHGPMVPLLPGSGPGACGTWKGNRVLVGGGGANDFAGQVAGTIYLAEASFPSVNNLTSVNDSKFGANAYSLQLNSEPFPGAPQCAGAADPAVCTGWQQFVYQGEWLFIEYWLLDFGKGCPTGWTQFPNPNVAGTVEEIDCVQNIPIPMQTFVGTLPITDLPYLEHDGAVGRLRRPDELRPGGSSSWHLAGQARPGYGSPVRSDAPEPREQLDERWSSQSSSASATGLSAELSIAGATINVALALETPNGFPPACAGLRIGESHRRETEQPAGRRLSPCCAVTVNPVPPGTITFSSRATPGRWLPTPSMVCPLYLNVNNSPLQLTQGGTSEAFALMCNGPLDHAGSRDEAATGVILIMNDARRMTFRSPRAPRRSMARGREPDWRPRLRRRLSARTRRPRRSRTKPPAPRKVHRRYDSDRGHLPSVHRATGLHFGGERRGGLRGPAERVRHGHRAGGQCTNGACENGFLPRALRGHAHLRGRVRHQHREQPRRDGRVHLLGRRHLLERHLLLRRASATNSNGSAVRRARRISNGSAAPVGPIQLRGPLAARFPATAERERPRRAVEGERRQRRRWSATARRRRATASDALSVTGRNGAAGGDELPAATPR